MLLFLCRVHYEQTIKQYLAGDATPVSTIKSYMQSSSVENILWADSDMMAITTLTGMQRLKGEKNQDEHISKFACAEVQKHLPQDLLPQVTVLFQGSGYVTISPRDLSGLDWRNMNEHVKQMGGLWVSNGRFSRWSIPFSRSQE